MGSTPRPRTGRSPVTASRSDLRILKCRGPGDGARHLGAVTASRSDLRILKCVGIYRPLPLGRCYSQSIRSEDTETAMFIQTRFARCKLQPVDPI